MCVDRDSKFFKTIIQNKIIGYYRQYNNISNLFLFPSSAPSHEVSEYTIALESNK